MNPSLFTLMRKGRASERQQEEAAGRLDDALDREAKAKTAVSEADRKEERAAFEIYTKLREMTSHYERLRDVVAKAEADLQRAAEEQQGASELVDSAEASWKAATSKIDYMRRVQNDSNFSFSVLYNFGRFSEEELHAAEEEVSRAEDQIWHAEKTKEEATDHANEVRVTTASDILKATGEIGALKDALDLEVKMAEEEERHGPASSVPDLGLLEDVNTLLSKASALVASTKDFLAVV